jgi:hypothetical protein
MEFNRICRNLLPGLALGAALVSGAAAQPGLGIATPALPDARPGFFSAALYPELASLPVIAVAPPDRVARPFRPGAILGAAPPRMPLEILPVAPRFGLAIDHSSGQPQIVGVSFRPTQDIELRAITGWSTGDAGLEGQLSVSFRF